LTGVSGSTAVIATGGLATASASTLWSGFGSYGGLLSKRLVSSCAEDKDVRSLWGSARVDYNAGTRNNSGNNGSKSFHASNSTARTGGSNSGGENHVSGSLSNGSFTTTKSFKEITSNPGLLLTLSDSQIHKPYANSKK